jgi:Pyridoxamine 5'-phosphate oxidase
MQDHIPQDACRILGAARTVHVAVHAARGPHVTPQAYLWTGDSLWLVTSRTSLKARVLRRRPQVGLLVRDGDESVILRGTAHVLWPTNIGSAVQAGLALPVVPLAGAAYAARNAPLLAGYASELLGRGAPVPYDRIFIRVQIDRGAVVCGDATVERWGDWSIPVGSAESPLAVAVGALPDGIPQEILAMIARARDAVLTCSTTSGLLPLPATWDGGTRLATVGTGPPSLLHSTADGPACLTVDRSTGVRMSRFSGLLLRGAVTPPVAGSRAPASLHVDRASWWQGFVTGTVATSGSDQPIGIPA